MFHIEDHEGNQCSHNDKEWWLLRITEKCKIPGYKYPVWYSKKAITNIICLKNLIKCYRVTYDSKLDTTIIVHHSAFGLPDLLFEMHPCSLHVCYPKKMGQFEFVQTMHDNMKLFSKCQIAGAVKARELNEKLIFPSTSDRGSGPENVNFSNGPKINFELSNLL